MDKRFKNQQGENMKSIANKPGEVIILDTDLYEVTSFINI